jgi:NhaP-type Na+/H+ or K+/H+ antiporter
LIVLQAIILLLAAWLSAQICRKLHLPPILGMIVAGALVGNFVWPCLPTDHWIHLEECSAPIRLAVLALILLRAGLGLSLRKVGRAGSLALRLGSLPMLGEALAVTLTAHTLAGMPWPSAMVLGFLVAAVSPAIVIPGLLDLLGKRTGTARRVPTALLAAAPLDNILAMLGFEIACQLAISPETSWLTTLAHLPYSIGLGALLGLTAGLLVSRQEQTFPFFHELFCLEVISCVIALVFVCQEFGLSPVICVLFMGGTLRAQLPKKAETLSVDLARIWALAQYVLFSLIGAALDLAPLVHIGLLSVSIILAGQLARAASVLLATIKTGCDLRQRMACVCSLVPKATIQAAFASLPLQLGLPQGDLILSVAVLAIVITAPIGVLTLTQSAEKLLLR